MEHSVSGSSSASCSVRTASPGPFRSLSSKWMTVNTIKKLSGGGSGSHHSAGASGMNENQQQKTLLRNNSKDNLSDACNESGVGPEAISAVVDTTEISIGNHGGDLGGDPMSAHTTISEGVQISGNCCCCGCHPISVSERDGASSAFNYDTDFGVNGNSTGSNKQNGAINNNKVQRMQNKLSGLRKKEKSKSVSSRKGKDSSSNTSISSELMMDDYSQYNYERQIEDFQRAARIFKEQKDLSTEAMLADAKAAVAEASAAAAAAAAAATAASVVMDGGSKLNLSAPSSLVVSPIQELSEEETMSPAVATPMAGEEARTTTIKPEKPRISGQSKSYTHPTYPSYRGDEIATPLSPQPPRRATASNISSSSRASPRKSLQPSQTSILRGIHSKGKNDSAYLESDQIGQDSILDLKLPRLGLASGFGGGFGVNSTTSGSPTSEYSALDLGSPRSNSHPSLRALSTRPEDGSRIRSDILDDIPLEDMVATPSSLGKGFPKRYEDGYSFKGRLSISSQQQPTAAAETMRGRSLHSVCSVDSVSQQIAARHQQNGRVHNLSNVASLHSQYADSMGCISASGSVGAMGPSEAMGNNGATAGACPTADMDMVLENSPIQVVRATVSNVDDTSLPCFTFRMWVLSTIFVIMGAAISEYNFFRTDSAYFSIYFVQLASYFCGKAMARWLPTRTFEIRLVGFGWIADKFRTRWGKRSTAVESTPKKEWDECNNQAAVADDGHYNQYISRDEPVPVLPNTKESQSPDQIRPRTRKSVSWKFTLNPGKFNMKEHMLIGIAAAAGCSPAYATNVLAIQDLIFNTPLGTMTGMGLVVSSQCIGFSMAWFLFDYVIKPSVMVWPATLVNVALYNTLHEHKVLTRWFTRMQLFWYAFFAVFIYQWFPRMFMPLLASMSFLCWVQPSSNVLRKLGSGYTGLGIGCISLDWSIISGVGPLYTPWWAQCNFFVGLILMLWIITPLVYFSDYWSALSYPIVSANLYDNTSELYDINRVVNKDLSFNKTMFEEYSPVIMTPYFAITYGTSFMAVIATFVHVALYYGSDIWLIAQVRFLRRISRLQEKPWVQRITGTVQGWAIVNLLCGSHADHDDDLPSVGLNTQSTVDVGSRTCLQNSRRNSEPPRFQDGGGLSEQPGVPLNTSNTGAASVDGLSAHRRQYSQGDGFLHISKPKATPRKATKVLDDQDQIPTEMFGTEDVHTRLMRNYSEIPGMWFGILLLVCFAMAIAVCISSEINLPVYALILALVLAAVFALPMAIIQALSSSQIGLNVLSEVVCGYLLPGNQLGNSVFKCYSYMALYQCLNLTQSFKLGHYMKVPPRQIFIMVVYGTLVGAFINLQVLDWVMLYNRDDLFSTDPRNGWSFRNLDLFFSASLLWGAISPTRLFSDGSIYHFLPYCFLIGAFIPIPCYLMYRHFPPYGTLCKGTTRSIPLLPKCKCPIPPQQPQSSPDATNGVVMNPTAVSAGSIPLMTTLQSVRGISSPSLPPPPPPLLGRRRLSEMLTDLEKNEGGRSFWPASPTVLSRSQVHDLPSPGEGFTGCRSTDGSSSYPPLSPTTAVGDPEGEVCSPASRGVSMMDDSLQQPQQPQRNTTIERTHSIPVEPHVYYGRPGSVWDHRLRRVPWHLVNMPLICVGASFVPQAPASFVMSAGIVAFCFAFLVLRYHHEWWRRYTFVLAAALDAGTQICNMAIFVVFSLILKGSVGFPAWFGNDPTNPERCGVGDGYN
ncbi:hypothetical protein BGW38_009623 [Lunasporangiospora selenospora]|uniref:Uncharacterized protein n=1 Tax=Lunasporangiospora selenospora TaxID=979761 RepID=A0A9P6KG26_9FUNG|nr:hypothetical protein BGW38_009623 [Lunasporangiospora selenospora]